MNIDRIKMKQKLKKSREYLHRNVENVVQFQKNINLDRYFTGEIHLKILSAQVQKAEKFNQLTQQFVNTLSYSNIQNIQKEYLILQKEYDKLEEIIDQDLRSQYLKQNKLKYLEKEVKDIASQTTLAITRAIQLERDISKDTHYIKELQIKQKSLQQTSGLFYELRKRANHELQEQKGNIRVYCRVRPVSQGAPRSAYSIFDSQIVINRPKQEQKSKNAITDYSFTFQKVFGQQVTQKQLFEQTVDVIQSAIDGKNVCVFAYGQTGSGKTFTMKGSQQADDNRGFIPRSIERIFEQAKKSRALEVAGVISVSIMQIYNDCIYDLIDSNKKLNSPNEQSFHLIADLEQGMYFLGKAMKNRTTATTKMNDQSSRSHLILTISNEFKSQQGIRRSNFVLVDLAGSQRINQSGVTGDRLIQAKNINKSLLELGNVLRAMKLGANSINFRNSKLTHCLQKYLSGDSKAIMFVNVSPDFVNEQQTIQSLKFAQNIRQIKLGNINVKK